MLYVKHYNATDNDWLVRKFETFKSAEGCFVEKFIPRPDVSIIFHFKSLPVIVGKPIVSLKPFFAAPIITESLILNMDGITDTFVVICNPTVLSRILKIDLTPRSKPGIDLSPDLFYPLWKTMLTLDSAEERIDCFYRFVYDFQKRPYKKDAVDILYDKIVEKGMMYPLKEIIRECNASQRTLERHFVKRTGVTPKTLMRIVRLNHLWSNVKHNDVIDYQNIVFDGRYFDQSHFINDFKSIVGESPCNFFKRDLNSIKIMSGNMEGLF